MISYPCSISQRGFTLVEIAVVLVIVGLLIGSFIGTVGERIETTRRDNTQKELKEIKRVLIAYAFSNSPPYLPCPDTDSPPDGKENRTMAGICDATFGHLPWVTLGVGYSDAWDNRYRYWVNQDYATGNPGAGFVLTTGDTANSATVETRIGAAKSTILDNAVAVVFSHGKNSLGGVSIDGVNRDTIPVAGGGHDDELENVDANVNFISRTLREEGATESNGGIFDDIVVWISSYELKAKMVEAGVLPL